jgi:type II secretory ATPase GspE/PulE/Tfp pilus assembly ATPase PilB-like protein/RNA polymerase subunit RPABC4/transcription elongation factor Spt4
MLAALRSPTRKIITAEDPVERRMEWATQVEVNEKQGLTFAILLRSILRQDPDTILVGEIRDNETAALAFRAAQTGHLVLSTLHTNDTVSTVSRLIDLGVERYVLPSSLNLILAQRLVRRVCDHCAQPYEPDSKLMSSLPVVPGTAQLRRGTGCEMCHRSGFSGRFAVFEVMPITPQLAQLIGAGASENMLRQRARQDGMRPLLEDATARMLAGMTTPEEVLRIVDIDEHENRCPNCRYVVEQDFLLCPNCSSPLRDQCVGCGMELRSAWHVCPYCGERRSELLGE